jgi:hypothetical protein
LRTPSRENGSCDRSMSPALLKGKRPSCCTCLRAYPSGRSAISWGFHMCVW